MQPIFLNEKPPIGATVQRIRKTAKVSQVALGELLGLHQSAISRIEGGQQNLSPDELLTLTTHFDISADALLSGTVNYWALAEKFKQKAPYPPRYREYPGSTVREIMPLFYFIAKNHGQPALHRLLQNHQLDGLLFQCPDQKIGVYALIDLFSDIVANGILCNRNFAALVDETRRPEIHGFLDRVYRVQKTSAHLLHALVLNADHYDSNFVYSCEERGKAVIIKATPARHMRHVEYRTEVLKDTFCKYRREFIANFPRYLGKPPLAMTERQCHFNGAESCIYELAL